MTFTRLADNPVVFWGVTGLLLAAALIALVGAVVSYAIQVSYAIRPRTCPLCDGCGVSGGRAEDDTPARTCPLCGGTGEDIPPPQSFRC